jgi:hypothetical protein
MHILLTPILILSFASIAALILVNISRELLRSPMVTPHWDGGDGDESCSCGCVVRHSPLDDSRGTVLDRQTDG